MKAVGVSVLERIRRTPPWRIDAVLATFLVLTGLTTTNQTEPIYEPRDGVAVALILAATLPYYVRRQAPLPVFVVSQTAIAAIFVSGYHGGALPFVLAVGAYTVGAHRPLREVVLAAVLQNVTFAVMVLSDSPGFGVPQYLTSVPLYAATMLVGWTMQSRRLRFDALEREQGEASLRAAADERLRIAQELHDVFAHSLGVIAVQAGVGMHVIETDPAEAKRALEHISRTSRSSLAEIRRVLGLVRSGEPTVAYANAGAGRPPTLGGGGRRRRPARRAGRRRQHRKPAAGRGAGGVPNRAGGTHQRAPRRPRPAGDGTARRACGKCARRRDR